MGCQVSDNRRLCDSPGKGEPTAFGCLLMQESTLSTKHRWSGRVRYWGPNTSSGSAGVGLHLAPLPNSNILRDTWQLSQSQVPHLENGNYNRCLTGSKWKFKTKGAEGRAPDRCSLHTYVLGVGMGRVCVHRETIYAYAYREHLWAGREISRQLRWRAPPPLRKAGVLHGHRGETLPLTEAASRETVGSTGVKHLGSHPLPPPGPPTGGKGALDISMCDSGPHNLGVEWRLHPEACRPACLAEAGQTDWHFSCQACGDCWPSAPKLGLILPSQRTERPCESRSELGAQRPWKSAPQLKLTPYPEEPAGCLQCHLGKGPEVC